MFWEHKVNQKKKNVFAYSKCEARSQKQWSSHLGNQKIALIQLNACISSHPAHCPNRTRRQEKSVKEW